MNAAEFIALLGEPAKARPEGTGWKVCCPAHKDQRPSLSVSDGSDGRTLIHCHAGCTPEAVCAAARITLADLMPMRTPVTPRPQIVATYDYHDADGKLLFQVVRISPNGFRQRRPDPEKPGEWMWNTKGIKKVLYRLPEIMRDIQASKPIFVCEGEKDVLAMESNDFTATSNPGGAGKWHDDYSEVLSGADVIIIGDKDNPGRNHAQQVAGNLHGKAKSVRVVEMPDINGQPVKDPADFFAAGGTPSQILDILKATPVWAPQGVPLATDGIMSEPSFAAATAEMRGAIVSILRDGNLTSNQQRTEIAKVVVQALAGRGRLFFHAERKDYDSAMYFDNERKQLLRIRSDAFSAWLSEWVYVNRADAIFKYISSQVETEALAGLHTTGILPESFWAWRPSAIYLSNGDGSIVKIRPGKVEIVDNGADGILFAAGNTLAAWSLGEPKDPFLTCLLFGGASCTAGHGLDLLRLWIVSLPTNPASKPPLCLAGAIGSGKTRLAKGIDEFFGLPIVINKVDDLGLDSFWPSLDAGGLFTLDNCDTHIKWLPDAVAAAATDGCDQRRKLYTDADHVTLRARAWLALTTANPTFATDAGLADRLLLVRMNRRMDETSDARLSDQIRENRNAGLSFIAHTLATALADTEFTPPGLNQRHPDFAAFAVRIGRALGREAEAIAALKQAESDKSAFCLENDPVGVALLAYLRSAQAFNGTASDLVPKLVEMDGELAGRLSPKGLSKRLAALWPHLQKMLAVASKETDRKGFLVFRFKIAEIADIETPFH